MKPITAFPKGLMFLRSLVFAALLLSLVGCDNGSKEQLANKENQIQSLSGERDKLKDQLEEAKGDLARLNRQQKEQNKEVAEQDKMIAELRASIKNKAVTVEKLGKRTRIRLPSNVLFRSGEAALAASGIRALKELAPVLKRYKGVYLEVAGFTDSSPIGPKLKKRYKNNLELSTDRATSVIDYLNRKSGLRHKMAAVGFGPQFPAVSNRTRGSRQENRRVIISLVPLKLRPR